MERLTTKDRLLLVGLFLLEAIIMFCIVPKANADEISVQVELVLGLSLALMISLAILIKHNRGKCKTILSIFIVCAATYLQISYCSLFYEWGVVICVTLPVFQLTFGFLISKFSQSITDLCTGCSNLMFSAIWANQMVGFLWFHHESSDLETVGIASACALVGVVIVFMISIIMIMKFNPKVP